MDLITQSDLISTEPRPFETARQYGAVVRQLLTCRERGDTLVASAQALQFVAMGRTPGVRPEVGGGRSTLMLLDEWTLPAPRVRVNAWLFTHEPMELSGMREALLAHPRSRTVTHPQIFLEPHLRAKSPVSNASCRGKILDFPEPSGPGGTPKGSRGRMAGRWPG